VDSLFNGFVDSEGPNQPVKLIVGAEGDGEGAAFASALEKDRGLEMLLEAILEAEPVGRLGRWGGGSSLPATRDEVLRLAHRQMLLQDEVANLPHALGAGQGEQSPGVPHGEGAVEDVMLDIGGELEKAKQIGYGCTVLAHPFGDFILSELKLILESLIGEGFLDAIEVPALDVFDECQLEHFSGCGVSQEDRDLRKSGQAGRLPSPLTREDLVLIGRLGAGGQNGLDDALLADGGDEVIQMSVLDDLARLVRVGHQAVYGTVEELDVLSLEPFAGCQEILESATETSFLVDHVS